MKILDHAASPAARDIEPDADVAGLPHEVLAAPSISLRFAKWTDGRAYSQARLLRARLGYAGELRAVGDVVVDMLPLLARTGFDAVVLRADQKRSTADRVLLPFSAHYQADVNESRPAYARHGRA